MPRLSERYNLAVKHPEIAKEWHQERNGRLTPFGVPPKSSRTAWWKCSTNGHEWKATIYGRARGNGCPKCRRIKRVSQGTS